MTLDQMVPALEAEAAADPFLLAEKSFASRLLLGTGGVPSLEVLERAVVASGTQLVTIALRRVEASMSTGLLEVLNRCGVQLLPNTAGCMTAREAVLESGLAVGGGFAAGAATGAVAGMVFGPVGAIIGGGIGAAVGGFGGEKLGDAIDNALSDP